MHTLNTIVVSRHYKHKNNVPTEEGLQIVADNTQAIADQFQWKEKANIFGTDKARTGGTANEIAKNLWLDVASEQVKDRLSYEPETGPMKDTYKKLSEYYDVDPDVAKLGYSDKFVHKMQHNELEGIDFNKFWVFNAIKLYNVISCLSKNKQADNELNIAGIHGGFLRESIIYTIRGDAMPEQRQWQIKMGENFIIKVVEMDNGNVWMSIDYRGVNQTISLSEIKEAIKRLR